MTDFKQKKEDLVAEFNKNQQILLQLQKRQDRILGGLELIEEIEKKEKEFKTEVKEEKEEKK